MISDAAKSFDILATSLIILIVQLFSDLYHYYVTFLDILARSFFP